MVMKNEWLSDRDSLRENALWGDPKTHTHREKGNPSLMGGILSGIIYGEFLGSYSICVLAKHNPLARKKKLRLKIS